MRRAAFLLVLPLAPIMLLATLADADAPREVRASPLRDPPPLTSQSQWIFDLRWDSGDVYLVGVRKVEMPAPMTTPRAMGRFAIELSEHGILVERTRFDFPGLAVPDPEGGIRMNAKLKTRIGVFFPVTPRGDKLELVDRTSGQRWALPWPPQPATDGGVDQ